MLVFFGWPSLSVVLFFAAMMHVYGLGSISYGQSSKPDTVTTEPESAKQETAASSAISSGSRSVLARSLEAGLVVFCVLLTLLIFSVMSWAISLYKVLILRGVYRRSRHFLESFFGYASLNVVHEKLNDFSHSPIKDVFIDGYDELLKSVSLVSGGGSQDKLLTLTASMDNISRRLKKSKIAARKHLESWLLFLAISASAAPFIGLFGTVWGIMNSFEGIAASGSSSLSVVAPGISEALVATAFGLAAAIPALIGYNLSRHHIRHILGCADDFIADFSNIVERHLVTLPVTSGQREAMPAAKPLATMNEIKT